MSDPPTPEPLIDRIARRIGESCSYLFLLCMLIIAYEVFARYALNAPTVWAHDLTISLCAVGFLMSGLYTLRRGAHIRITLVYDRLPATVRRVLDVINGAIMLGFLGLLAYQTAPKRLQVGQHHGDRRHRVAYSHPGDRQDRAAGRLRDDVHPRRGTNLARGEWVGDRPRPGR